MLVFKNKTLIVLLGILFLGLFLRVYNLDNTPPGVTNDEAGYVYNGYSLWKTGKDITGAFLPLSINLDNSFSPVPAYLMAPIVGNFGISLFTSRLANAFIGVLFILILYLFTKALVKDKSIALVAAFVVAVMPWHIHFSRTAYEAPLALFFYCLGFYLFISKKSIRWLVLAFFSFILGFYSYHATKLFFIAFFPILLFVRYKILHESSKKIGLSFVLFALILGSFFYVSKTQHVSRGNIFLWNDVPKLTHIVNSERREVSKYFSLTPVYINKITTFMRLARENYFELYSPHFLFLYGEVGGLSGIYGTYNRGVLYFIEFPLLLWGIYVLHKYVKKPILVMLISGLFVAGLPSAFAVDKSYAVRSIMLIPFLSIFTATGFIDLILKFKKNHKLAMYLFGGLFFLLYVFSISSYSFQYLSRYPVYGAESWFVSSKDLYSYITKKENQGKDIVIANPGDLLIQFAFYGTLDPALVSSVYKQNAPKKIGNIQFIKGCIDTHEKVFEMKDYFKEKTIYVTKPECHKETPAKYLISDRGEALHVLWKIYELN